MRRLWVGGVLLVVICVVGLGVGGLWLRRHLHVKKESRQRHETVARGPRLRVARVKAAAAVRELTLPADVRGILQATLYAKTAGYLARITVYGGDRVKKGQLLAVIASPETDQQVAEARADLIFKDKTAQRARLLASRDFIARQDLDQAESALQVSRATLSRLRSLQGYQTLRAPFDGVVTFRYVDQGALIPVAATPVVDVANLTRVRVLVPVAQDAAASLHVGDPAVITVEERPGEKIAASITRFGPALDVRSRSMLAELWLDNREARLYPGSFVKVTLKLSVPPLPQVPSAAVTVRGGKLMAGVVEGEHVKLQPVAIGLDDGRTVQVKSGLTEGQVVVLNLPPEVGDGAAIQPVDN